MRVMVAHAAPEMTQWPYQIKAHFSSPEASLRLRDRFPDLLPAKPYAADNPRHGLVILTRLQALQRRHIQLNGPNSYTWMTHDIDDPGAYYAHRDNNVPQPNVIVINPANRHAHASYLLAVPVARHCAARAGPLRLFAAVERGIARRIGADHHYGGLITKNPLHPDWHAEWRRDAPYTLPELADWLFPKDTAPDLSFEVTIGAGRNCAIFDALRVKAYSWVREFKRSADVEGFQGRLSTLADNINGAFPLPLSDREVGAIVRSVSRWTWSRFSEEGFSRRQSLLGKRGADRRWAGHHPAEASKPWLAEGVSRSTWYRKRRRMTEEGGKP